MALILEVKPDTDIWKEHPNLKLLSQFQDLHDKEGAEKSSNIIKAIFTIFDPKSKLRDSGVSEENLIKEVSHSLLEDEKFNWLPYKPFIDYFLDANTNKLEKMLVQYEQEIEQLETVLSKWKWAKTNIKEKNVAMKEYRALIKSYAELREEVKAQAGEEMSYEGGYGKSMLESLGDKE